MSDLCTCRRHPMVFPLQAQSNLSVFFRGNSTTMQLRIQKTKLDAKLHACISCTGKSQMSLASRYQYNVLWFRRPRDGLCTSFLSSQASLSLIVGVQETLNLQGLSSMPSMSSWYRLHTRSQHSDIFRGHIPHILLNATLEST